MKSFILLLGLFITCPLWGQEDIKKPECRILSSSEFKAMGQSDQAYMNYHDYLYSRVVKKAPHESLSDLLIADHFSYPDLDNWIKKTERMNQVRPRGGEFYLPPCFIAKEKPPEVVPEVIQIVEPPAAPIKKVVKKNPPLKRLRYQAGITTGQVSITSNDSLNSSFVLRFLKVSGSAQYALSRDFFFFGGIGINNYFYVNFKSDNANENSHDISPYVDSFFGIRAKNHDHVVSLQYDNLNYFLNENNNVKLSLIPTRVDRISLHENYILNKKFSLMLSVGLYQPLFSKATGYDYGAGVSYRLNEKLSSSFIHSRNEVSKNSVKNKAQAYVLGLSYVF